MERGAWHIHAAIDKLPVHFDTVEGRVRSWDYEFGLVLPEGHRALLKAMPDVLADAAQRLPAMLMESLNEQLRRIAQLSQDIDQIEHRLAQQLRESPHCQSVAQIPGVGLLTATHQEWSSLLKLNQ